METGKEVVRKCISCGLKQDRKNQIRILQDYITGEYIIGPKKKQFGKSIYVCNQSQCINKLEKHKRYKTKLDFALIKGKLEQNKGYDYCRQN